MRLLIDGDVYIEDISLGGYRLISLERHRALWQVLQPLMQQNRPVLRERATRLKQGDGESWAIGESIERACILFDAIELNPAQDIRDMQDEILSKKGLDFE